MSSTPKDKMRQVHQRLDKEFPYFSRHILKIQDKETGIICPFEFNTAQTYLHEEIEKQAADIGRVRILIVKGRQQGCSTYVEGRYYWRAARHHNKKVFILSHQAKTTKMLFDMVERYWEMSPAEAKPEAKVANRQELVFKSINSQYAVGTAGSADVGRGGTVHLFHGSEVAFWENVQDIKTGVLQSIPGGPGTEIILESTANGMSNAFYTMCMAALENKSDYKVVFIPWYWQSEYRRPTPADGEFGLSEEEQEYKDTYSLEDDQIYWRREKIVDFGEEGGWMFKQEYPAYLQEAFQTSGRTLISPQSIIRARKADFKDPTAPLILGVDPARTVDRIILAPRQGRHYWPHIELKYGKEEEQISIKIAQRVAQWITEHKPDAVNIDAGEGMGVVDHLQRMGYSGLVRGVYFGGGATEKEIYANKRAEMWCRLRDHIQGEDGPVNLPDSNDLQKDLMSMPEPDGATASGKIKMVSKVKVKKDLGCSPDIGDGYALTHYEYLHKDIANTALNGKIRKKKGSSPLISSQRARGNRQSFRS